MSTEALATRRATRRLRPLAVALFAGAALVGAACVPETPPVATTTTESTTTTTEATTTTLPEEPVCEGLPATASNGAATLTVSKATCLEVGDVVTVAGTGFTTTGNIATRAPLGANWPTGSGYPARPAGVYANFGKFADTWRPSAGMTGSTRTILVQTWPLPSVSYASLAGDGQAVEMNPDGSFSTTITIVDGVSANPNLGFATYAGSGAVNANEEIFIAASFAPVDAG